MRLIQTTPVAAFPVADRSRDGELYETEHPRLAAIRHLREAIADGRAGLDPYDQTVFLLGPLAHERVWARAAIEQTGLFLGETLNPLGGCRYRMILEADVRQELGLDGFDAPVLRDGALASRRLERELQTSLDEAAAVNAGLELLENPKTPVLRAVADARNAQQRAIEREVH